MSRRKERKPSTRSKSVRRRRERKERKARRAKRQTNRHHANHAMRNFFGDTDIFSEYRFHGNIKWSPGDLARIGLLFSWSEKKNVTDAFTEAIKRAGQLGITITHTTYQGFMGALSNYVHIFIPLLILQLQRKMLKVGGAFREVSGFVPIGFDGSRNNASRTRSNEEELCSDKGKRKAAESPSSVTDPRPQAWITLMWHMGLRLPWDWRLGPSDSSERRHVQEMIQEGSFPKNTLFCGDAGFVGYAFWRSILESGHDFLVRVGGNVRLIGETVNFQQLNDDEVLCWPKENQDRQPPLRLRLVRVTIGNADVYLLTSVLSSERLPIESMVSLYKMRWGIEIEFRGLKQTLNGDKLSCRNVDRLYTELHWSLLSMAVAELLALTEQLASQTKEYTPAKRSLAQTMRAIYACLDDLRQCAASGADLFTQLANALTDRYLRTSSKKARYRPKVHEKKKNKNKPPEIRRPTSHERKKLTNMNIKTTT